MKLNEDHHKILEHLLTIIDRDCTTIHDVVDTIEEALVDDEL